ncbi:hypothetical protein [Pseudalkalibacillus hwajinpoensis]|uniref:PepSY domain-containing protein n=1 Tax=Guptibacillus hwajinpoensis TaxID=208199 RepID=A0A4U1MNG0_9BACL|nr:hypothetical protein [Pseudalkalibacillus hwajinpoensis]TKD72152.1 hypothetical protein FBF83_04955 [Pseudalkalibacillus hwajinpoensis]
MNKWSFYSIAIIVAAIASFYLYIDARTLDVKKSELPVDQDTAIQISQRYLAGGWKDPVDLHLTPYSMKSTTETKETFVVDIMDESDPGACTGYEVVVEKQTGNVIEKQRLNYCD